MTVMDNNISDFLHDKFLYMKAKSRDIYGSVFKRNCHDFKVEAESIMS